MQEFYVNLRRKARRPISITSARSLVADYMAWDPIVNDGTSILEAMDAGTGLPAINTIYIEV
ncbi:MAG: hypothetical protein GWP02_06565 [Desulfobulbaceae bacterium]|nr:hypothetical protein [Desulfobulbaceae bacterium]